MGTSYKRCDAEGRKNMKGNQGPEKILRRDRQMERLDC
jgi:hypothetical protein